MILATFWALNLWRWIHCSQQASSLDISFMSPVHFSAHDMHSSSTLFMFGHPKLNAHSCITEPISQLIRLHSDFNQAFRIFFSKCNYILIGPFPILYEKKYEWSFVGRSLNIPMTTSQLLGVFSPQYLMVKLDDQHWWQHLHSMPW